MSLNAFHQAIRQRTWNQSVQSIYDALKRNEIVVPPKVRVAGLEEKSTCGRSIVVMHWLPKPAMRVRFPSPAFNTGRSAGRTHDAL